MHEMVSVSHCSCDLAQDKDRFGALKKAAAGFCMTNLKEVHILIIDDDDTSTFLTEKVIQNYSPQIHVHSARSASQAFAFLRGRDKKLPHIIIVDLNMAEMSGFKFIEEFRKLDLLETRLSQLVIVSSSLSINDLRRANALRVPFFGKPLSEKDVGAMVSIIA
jgi:CheY-like chemotaxis protein